jgi:hypothetical protein
MPSNLSFAKLLNNSSRDDLFKVFDRLYEKYVDSNNYIKFLFDIIFIAFAVFLAFSKLKLKKIISNCNGKDQIQEIQLDQQTSLQIDYQNDNESNQQTFLQINHQDINQKWQNSSASNYILNIHNDSNAIVSKFSQWLNEQKELELQRPKVIEQVIIE